VVDVKERLRSIERVLVVACEGSEGGCGEAVAGDFYDKLG